MVEGEGKLQTFDKRYAMCTVIVIVVFQGISAELQPLLSVIGSFIQAFFFSFLSLFRAFLGNKILIIIVMVVVVVVLEIAG